MNEISALYKEAPLSFLAPSKGEKAPAVNQEEELHQNSTLLAP